jgi:hypothetical protein
MEHFTFIESPIWGFAPLALLVIGSLILIAKDFGWLGRERKRGSAMIEAATGDYVLRDKRNNEVFRIHMAGEIMTIDARNQLVIIASIYEAGELRDWITRRLVETNP